MDLGSYGPVVEEMPFNIFLVIILFSGAELR